MKIVSKEEIDAHSWATIAGGFNGFCLGTLVSVGVYAMAPRYYPKLLKMPWSIKTATAIIPPAFTTAVNAELASTRFDSEMYSSEFQQRKVLEEHRRWAKLSTTEKMVESLSNNKYKIITGLWAASMVGSWMYVNRDPLLTRTQKFVQARMYAQFITVALLLGSIGLSVYEENHHLNQHESGDDAYLREVLEANRQK
ncbi:hypothetical protein KL930_003317 [Ogataea haglerorum]|uniref:HIG1 domain-containing protein n=1 Tax=Ogataea haglerorum TaxID=1937702 RepID=A0AAN6D1R4_9ASCO|nr:uncharacterized protein KL911_002432 [Ogataea haglerorum]KAG7696291.1 hypothetical protein KL915_002655 [Ogataea haglerorum]KAG7696663.1 hypothetical protein KL951_003119 [Ogataea haglerorum]KAG7706893.1 hypothetical protein KL914_002777 [Ogataea haglerorum]KAG7708800.1 hypothetical protein KL950_002320 [Ogataea haglerorum]KAG7716294.1 hypothetical protein KL913_003505 [Ogataea haglerorum]